jgi:hypothetical protein
LSKRKTKLALIAVAVVVALLWLSTIQAKFYPESLLLERATVAKDRALSKAMCDDVRLLSSLDNPPGGVKLYSWACFSSKKDSVELSVKIEDDGYPHIYSAPIICGAYPQFEKPTYSCTKDE